MLVRAGNDGEWLQLTPVEGIPSGGFRSLCGADAANLLETDTPMPVAAFGPWPAGSLAGVDAVCLTPSGDIELLVGTWGEQPRDTLWRMLDVAGALRGTSLEAFASHLTELGSETSVTRWLHAKVGGDAHALEARLRHVLETGDFGFVLVTSSGAGDLAQPLHFVQQGNVRIRVFEVEVLRAGAVEAIEGIEVPLVAGAEAASHAPVATTVVSAEAERPAPTLTVVPTPEPEVAAPEPEPEAEAEPRIVAESAEPEPVTFLEEPEVEDMPAAPEDPSDVDAFFALVDRLDHRTSAHLRWLHDALLRLVDEAEYTTDGTRQFVTGWMHGAERLPLYLLDSHGLLQLILASLPEHEQREFADEVAGMLPETSGSILLKAGYADIDVPAHLDDQTLLEYLVDNLVEALPGGRESFGTHGPMAPLVEERVEESASETTPDDHAEASSDGDDFFAGVSAGHDPSDVESAVASLSATGDEPATAADPEPEAETEVEAAPEEARAWAEPAAPQQQKSGSRWLRRRGAA